MMAAAPASARVNVMARGGKHPLGELFPTISHPKKRAYLIAFAETGNKVQAAKAAGVSHATVYSPDLCGGVLRPKGGRRSDVEGAAGESSNGQLVPSDDLTEPPRRLDPLLPAAH